MGKILVVDDQFGVRTLLVETFQDDGHEVKSAKNGEEALQVLKSFEPDLILLEMKMPGMNGIEILEQIRALDSLVTVIMMSSYGDPQAIKQLKDFGIIYYVDKPFDLFKLRERVREILNSLE